MPIVRCASAYHLLEQLHNVQTITEFGTWIFRGQARASWRLMPSLFRRKLEAEDEQEFEAQMLVALTSSLKHRTVIPDRFVGDLDYQLVLAQHYGCPTRLLDWSVAPLHGAYFAASDSIRERKDEDMSVFATAEKPTIRSPNGAVTLVVPTFGGNDNVAAQRGVLMLHDWSCRDLWRSAHEVNADDARSVVSADPVSRLIRFDLSRQHAHELLDELARRGVDGTTVFPGPHGLVRDATDRAERVIWHSA